MKLISIYLFICYPFMVFSQQVQEYPKSGTKIGTPWCTDTCYHLGIVLDSYNTETFICKDLQGNLLPFPKSEEFGNWFNTSNLSTEGCGTFKQYSYTSTPVSPLMKFVYFLRNPIYLAEDSVIIENGRKTYPIITYFYERVEWTKTEYKPVFCAYKTGKNGFIRKESDSVTIRMFIQDGIPQYVENVSNSPNVIDGANFWCERLNENILPCKTWFNHFQTNGVTTFYLYFQTKFVYLCQYYHN